MLPTKSTLYVYFGRHNNKVVADLTLSPIKYTRYSTKYVNKTICTHTNDTSRVLVKYILLVLVLVYTKYVHNRTRNVQVPRYESIIVLYGESPTLLLLTVLVPAT